MKAEKIKNNKAEIDKKIEALTSKIEENPYSQQQGQKYVQRSEQFQLLQDYESAITDLSKSLCLYPSCEGYVKRGKLYASSDLFYFAMMDFQEANLLYQNQKKEKLKSQKEVTDEKAKKENAEVRNTKKINKNIDPQTEQFLQKSTIIVKLPQLKQIAKKHEKSKQYMPVQFNDQFNKLMSKMIQQRVNAELKAMKEENKNYQKLLELVKKQDERIQQLEKGLENKVMDYQAMFYKEIQQSMLSNANKQKCIIYFCTVISEMEKYYLSAKVLSQFQQKISFEDYQQKTNSKLIEKDKKAGFSWIQKIFKLFEKHQQKLERIGQVIKEIPYIGAAFKMMKPTLKVFGWFEQIKEENQCQNILSTRPSVTSFNKMSAKIAYQMCKYFKVNITTSSKIANTSELYKKNCWQKMAKLYKKFKRNQMGVRIFNNVQPSQKVYAQEMGNTHATILMGGVAFGIFKLPKELQLQTDTWQKDIFEKVGEIQSNLWNTPVEEKEIEQLQEKQQPEKQKKGCNIF